MTNVRATMQELLSPNNISQNPYVAFWETAHFLMNKCILNIENKNYRIIELEFYYLSEAHQDCYIHAYNNNDDGLQYDFGRWYPHGSGIDLTFGNEDREIAGGILLRGIRYVDSKEAISGPVNLREPMIVGNHKNVKATFSDLKQVDSVFNEKERVCIIENQGYHFDERIISSTRVGLEKKNKDDQNMINKEYRFIADFDKRNDIDHPFREKEKVAQNLYEKGRFKVADIHEMFNNSRIV